ncbi:hypothetical protein BLA60_39410 [Actinophytocola xinjiangensis]|uniref:DNA primase/polymerase bifunctional N-terminal domain-containing protein n=1 Tax=Actinophytocola xinjiangensis TaxID=485602 RepID=A0A7Z0WDA8_9PSEU|nr:hypothetical protein [Actinophytocola xinjiangensis]OLF04694.1 hypothetical protein BLA60_39410 [Actinophytocola xinjiangensis]
MITNHPAPHRLRELATGRAAYEELLGWPVTVQVSRRELALVAGPDVSAMTMPTGLGALVRKELGVAMQHAPIVSTPDSRTWTFLTRPPELRLRTGVADELALAGVVFTPPGGHVALPRSPVGLPAIRTWQWVDPPTPGAALPPAYPVIAVTRRITARRHHDLGQRIGA